MSMLSLDRTQAAGTSARTSTSARSIRRKFTMGFEPDAPRRLRHGPTSVADRARAPLGLERRKRCSNRQQTTMALIISDRSALVPQNSAFVLLAHNPFSANE